VFALERRRKGGLTNLGKLFRELTSTKGGKEGGTSSLSLKRGGRDPAAVFAFPPMRRKKKGGGGRGHTSDGLEHRRKNSL